jgi:hypothetical protein
MDRQADRQADGMASTLPCVVKEEAHSTKRESPQEKVHSNASSTNRGREANRRRTVLK